MNTILNSSTSTKEQKKLIIEVKSNLLAASEKYKIPISRLFPVVDFEFMTSYVWFD